VGAFVLNGDERTYQKQKELARDGEPYAHEQKKRMKLKTAEGIFG
jgi:hypothetical protein